MTSTQCVAVRFGATRERLEVRRYASSSDDRAHESRSSSQRALLALPGARITTPADAHARRLDSNDLQRLRYGDRLGIERERTGALLTQIEWNEDDIAVAFELLDVQARTAQCHAHVRGQRSRKLARRTALRKDREHVAVDGTLGVLLVVTEHTQRDRRDDRDQLQRKVYERALGESSAVKAYAELAQNTSIGDSETRRWRVFGWMLLGSNPARAARVN